MAIDPSDSTIKDGKGISSFISINRTETSIHGG